MSKFLLCALVFCCLTNRSCSVVQLKSVYTSFPDSPARFTGGLNGSAICGDLRLADPIDACSPLLNEVEYSESGSERIALIVRGGCAFEEKVRHAQDSGFRAAIVYDDEHNQDLISMMGSSEGIWIHAVFVSNAVGEILKEQAVAKGGECCIASFLDETAWTVLVISFISVLAVITLLVMVFFSFNHRWNHIQQPGPIVMEGEEVDVIPCIMYYSANLTGHVGETCAICLEDYKDRENLKLLPCNHVFHATCVNSWLTKWATFCPVCKHDARVGIVSSE
ncbi:receptor homology region, transmembrane domain- and RING domain-containing protein 1 isoform X2 [Andrographis paniculata]|uniref:receptor homology region, transmembrane domain- and RING domain-containing protein 1 isoform X2 n=1 Tax=Andrographis paniculata TaxID=175694 RepID=UPI0021E8AA0B|nr:receptor homology region, transmembrane domain- and RING domain-containing protein 1 isoform X2 [Andrographis paniculata]